MDDAPPGTPWLAAPGTPVLPGDELHIWRARLELNDERVEQLAYLLSADEADRAERFVFRRDRDRFMVARVRLRQILGAYLGVAPPELRFAYTRFGKPSLTGRPEHQRLGFNLAHSADLALYVLAWERRVGVDLEHIRAELDYETVMPNVFSPREQDAIRALPEPQRRASFFAGWVCKEAYLKAGGQGLSYPPDRVEVAFAPGAPASLRLPPEDDAGRWQLHSLNLGSAYAAAVVADGDSARLRFFDF